MSALASALAYRRLLDDNPTMRFLRADLVAVVAALLGAHLGAPGARIPTEELHERVDADLDMLRDHLDLGTKTAKAYCDDWRTAGFLIRRPAVGSRGETFELSPAAIDALRVLETLREPRSALTESRLVNLAAALHRLAIETDPDVTRRIGALRAERDRIDAEIAHLESGAGAVLEASRAVERVGDVLQQARGLPGDFARVRARFAELNQELRTSILDADDTQSAVLDDVFRGVDLIESSDEGRTFSAFSSLLRDPEAAAALDADIADILDRDFAQLLPAESRRALRTLLRDLKNGSREVHGVLTEFARGLRRYVHSQEFHRDRALRSALQDALAAAVPASRQLRPYTDVGLDLELSAAQRSSVGEVVPHDPSDYDTGAALADAEPATLDFAALAALARETEIDFAELVDNVNDVLADVGPVGIGDVLAAHPATQGVASVVGLLSLATRFGARRPGDVDRVRWRGPDDVERHAAIDRFVFTERVHA